MIGYWDAVGLDVDRHKCGATMRVSKIPVADQPLKHHVISQVVVGRRPCWWTRDPHIRFRLTTSVPGGTRGRWDGAWSCTPREARVPMNWWPSGTGPLKASRPWEIWSKFGARWNHQGPDHELHQLTKHAASYCLIGKFLKLDGLKHPFLPLRFTTNWSF
jgi:hypothetical protein